MTKITLTNLANLQNENTAVSAINDNNVTLVAALDNTLSRDGTSPNQMTSVIDMNSNKIINLPDPVEISEPATLNIFNKLIAGKGNVPAGGSTGQVLTKNSNVAFDDIWSNPVSVNLTGPITSVGSATSVASQTGTGSKFVMDTSPTLVTPNLGTPSVINLTNAQSLPLTGDITTSGASLTTSLTSNVVTNAKLSTMAAFTLKGNATGGTANPTDVSIPALTSKATPINADQILIADSAAAGAFKVATLGSLPSSTGVTSIAGNAGAFTLTGGLTNTANAIKIATGAIPGVTDGSNATAGNVGEYLSSTVLAGSAVSAPTGTAINVTTLSLTAGDWDVSGNVLILNSSGTLSFIEGWISSVSATQPVRPNNGMDCVWNGSAVGGTLGVFAGLGRVSITSTTTYYLSTLVTTSGTASAYGFIGARRIR